MLDGLPGYDSWKTDYDSQFEGEPWGSCDGCRREYESEQEVIDNLHRANRDSDRWLCADCIEEVFTDA